MNTDITPPTDPWILFAAWFDQAKQHEEAYPDAMTLATVGASGMPSARVVLIKDFDAQGIVFHTNRESRKGHELAAHAQASVCFYWKSLQRQIRIEGNVAPISDAESDAYFATRPRGSQIGAWASQQSQILDDRATLEKRIADFEHHYADRDVPRPPHWGGYRLTPVFFEFWQERLYRLHDRFVYNRAPAHAAWTYERLYP
jgi:pyridoxamine 5'-phosphate oxidase